MSRWISSPRQVSHEGRWIIDWCDKVQDWRVEMIVKAGLVKGFLDVPYVNKRTRAVREVKLLYDYLTHQSYRIRDCERLTGDGYKLRGYRVAVPKHDPFWRVPDNVWAVDFRNCQGKRVRRSLGYDLFTDKPDAWVAAKCLFHDEW